jgi:hypothetical protein
MQVISVIPNCINQCVSPHLTLYPALNVTSSCFELCDG